MLELVLAQPALATATNTTFSIHITEPDNNSDAARTMVAINAYAQYFLDSMNTWMSETGQTKIEMPNGEIVTLDSIKKMQGDIASKLDTKKGGIQRVEGELRLSNSVGVVNSDERNAAWLSLVRGHPDFYVKRAGQTNCLYSFPDPRLGDRALMGVGDFGIGLNATTGTAQAENTNANNLVTNGFWASGGGSANFYNPFGPLISSAGLPALGFLTYQGVLSFTTSPFASASVKSFFSKSLTALRTSAVEAMSVAPKLARITGVGIAVEGLWPSSNIMSTQAEMALLKNYGILDRDIFDRNKARKVTTMPADIVTNQISDIGKKTSLSIHTQVMSALDKNTGKQRTIVSTGQAISIPIVKATATSPYYCGCKASAY